MEKQCEAAMEADKVNSYSFKSTDFVTSYDYGTPPQWGKTQDAEYEMTMGWDSHLLLDYSMNKAYAEDNDLLLCNAVETAQKQIEALYHCEKLKLTNVATFDRIFYKKSKEKIRNKATVTWKCIRCSGKSRLWQACKMPFRKRDFGMKTCG